MFPKYQALLKKLEDYKIKILSSVQKGKELRNEQGALSFVDTSVQELESRWNEAYEKALGKLNHLKVS